ncbi:hypothetical protein TCDM_04061 [Trypanosoma cruzi Dm28c]|uniref:Uncharacterized protein n=1 Tax=Trypanosoma cruzi Dm28c TaxID=1416333 RepID=V5BM91_TRYCR|nr:hypothetical protein TCDM_04061 [Trypanosoma cruzi Dm28c]KAF8276148.1 hypothetical protein TcBrA4_0131800 [Trypanosoma cruzi]PBJ72535.1 hypothetical protein BCY84_15386 [Trypanosoma cruzi cruzi]
MERTRSRPPQDAQRVFLRELLGGFSAAKTGTEMPAKQSPSLSLQLESNAMPLKKSNSPSVSTQEGCGLSPPALFSRGPQLNGGQQDPVLLSGVNYSPRISLDVAKGPQGLRQRRYNDVSSVESVEEVVLPNVPLAPHMPKTPSKSTATLSPQHSFSLSSMSLQGAGNGRRIFKRFGMHTVCDMRADDAGSSEGTGGISKKSSNGLTPNVMEESIIAPYVRPWLRPQQLSSFSSPTNGLEEMALINLKSMPLRENTRDASLDKRSKPSSMDENKLRYNCPNYRAENEGDARVVELPRTDSSHYIRSYALTSTRTTVNASENPNEEKNLLERQQSARGTVAESFVAAPGRKSSAMLTRTLSELRSKSKRGSTVVSSPGLHCSVQDLPTTGKGQGSLLKRNSSFSCDSRINCEKWNGNISPNGSSSSSSNSSDKKSSEDPNCRSSSLLSCVNNSKRGKVPVNGGRLEKYSPDFNAAGCAYCVTYNNFFEEGDIPSLSVENFRRSSDLSGKVIRGLGARSNSPL